MAELAKWLKSERADLENTPLSVAGCEKKRWGLLGCGRGTREGGTHGKCEHWQSDRVMSDDGTVALGFNEKGPADDFSY